MKTYYVITIICILFGACAISGFSLSIQNIEKSGLEEPGLVGFWSFDEINNNTIPDESDNENNGILVGAAQGYGLSGLGVYFDGLDDSINIDDDPSLNFDDTNEFSISIWIQRKRVGIGFEETLLSKAITFLNSGYRLNIDTNNKVKFILNTDSKVCEILSINQIDDLLWHHIVAVWNKGTQSIYIDGMLDNSVFQGSYVVNYFTKPLELGIHFGFLNPYEGYIDELRIFDRALSTEEINELYTNPPLFYPKIILGKITNLKENIGDIIIFDVKNIRVIELFPFQFLQYSSGEKIKASNEFYGFVNQNFALGLFNCKVYN
jgi:hypothetical protein